MRMRRLILPALTALSIGACGTSKKNSSTQVNAFEASEVSSPSLTNNIVYPSRVLSENGEPIYSFPEAQRYDLSAATFDEKSSSITNPYFLLKPNRVTVFEGQTDDAFERIVLEVLSDTRIINGIDSAIVMDTVYHDGVLVEKTFDWFAQDTLGRVWYMGEEVEDFENGVLTSTAGSWEAGKDVVDNGHVATAGIQMLNKPQINAAYYQEFYETEAEDAAIVVDIAAPVRLKNGSRYTTVKVLEWVPLEPGSYGYKYYAENIGMVLETNIDGNERLELISISD